MDVNSLSHTKWNCKYHIVFAPKFRRKIAYGQLKQDIANILSMLCKRKGVKPTAKPVVLIQINGIILNLPEKCLKADGNLLVESGTICQLMETCRPVG